VKPRQARQPVSPKGLVTASALKLRVSKIVTSDRAGRVIGTLTRKRISHQGLWFDTRSSDFSPSVRAQMFWGAYEGAETRMIRSSLHGSTTVVELGSSLGVTTAHIAAVMTPGGHLICVEANPRLVGGLRDRTAPHAASLRVQVVHAAVTGHCGTTNLTLAEETVGSRIGEPRTGESTVEVPALTLREILRRTGVADFDLVSDIEGAEAAFLLNDPAVLDRCGRAVIEFHDTTVTGGNVSIFDLIDVTVAAGLRVVSRRGPVLALARSS
jgi:FkbM family methyltransferase